MHLQNRCLSINTRIDIQQQYDFLTTQTNYVTLPLQQTLVNETMFLVIDNATS